MKKGPGCLTALFPFIGSNDQGEQTMDTSSTPVITTPNIKKYALIVGINKYISLSGNNLQGCVNDANDMKSLLTEIYGFNPDNIRMLIDEMATKQNILEQLNWLVNETEDGAQLVFHFSGHGSQVVCRDGDEDDNKDEILCPTDLKWSDPLTDDIIATYFKQIKQNSRLTFISDSCLAADTKIPLVDGIEKTIKTMAEESGEYWIWAEREDGKIVPGKAHDARITGKKKLIKITFDSGIVECTEDHLFLMQDGAYRESGKLKTDDYLRPLYIKGGCNNHKVVKIEDTGKIEDVYDLTVDEFHNFALSCGVFVHNCHSGSADRDLDLTKPINHPRYIKPPFDMETRSRGRILKTNRIGWRGLTGPRGDITRINPQRHMLLSGCRDDQTSADACFNGRFNGALTYYLISSVRSNPDNNWLIDHKQIIDNLLSNGYSQVPQLSGSDDMVDGKPFGGK